MYIITKEYQILWKKELGVIILLWSLGIDGHHVSAEADITRTCTRTGNDEVITSGFQDITNVADVQNKAGQKVVLEVNSIPIGEG